MCRPRRLEMLEMKTPDFRPFRRGTTPSRAVQLIKIKFAVYTPYPKHMQMYINVHYISSAHARADFIEMRAGKRYANWMPRGGK